MSKTTQHLQDVALDCGMTVGEYLKEIEWRNQFIREEDEILAKLDEETKKEENDGSQ
jgi:hypothetical protein